MPARMQVKQPIKIQDHEEHAVWTMVKLVACTQNCLQAAADNTYLEEQSKQCWLCQAQACSLSVAK